MLKGNKYTVEKKYLCIDDIYSPKKIGIKKDQLIYGTVVQGISLDMPVVVEMENGKTYLSKIKMISSDNVSKEQARRGEKVQVLIEGRSISFSDIVHVYEFYPNVEIKSLVSKEIKGALDEKDGYVRKSVVPVYAGAAGAVVTTTSFVPVPFTDSVALMAIQTKMTSDIIKAYGLEVEGGVLVSAAGSQVLTFVGKTLVSQMMGLIPGLGAWAKATVNVTVAMTVTATWGVAISWLCGQYKCGKLEGKVFSDVLTRENLEAALEWAKKSGLIESIVKLAEQKR